RWPRARTTCSSSTVRWTVGWSCAWRSSAGRAGVLDPRGRTSVLHRLVAERQRPVNVGFIPTMTRDQGKSSLPHEQAIIAGAAPIGRACAISARRRGLDPLVIDAGAIANSIVRYPINMTFFTTPERLEIGGHPLVCAGAKPTREEALKYYRGVV